MSPYVRRVSVRGPERRAARSVFFLALALFTATFVGAPHEPGGEASFLATRALVHLTRPVHGPEADAAERAMHRDEHPEDVERVLTACATIGDALGSLPLYAVGAALSRAFVRGPTAPEDEDLGGPAALVQRTVFGWRNPLFAACTAALVVIVAVRSGCGRRTAWTAGVGYAVTSFAWPEARALHPGAQLAFCTFAAYSLVLRMRDRTDRWEPPRRNTLPLLGVACGLALATDLRAAPVVLVVVSSAVLVFARARRRALQGADGAPAARLRAALRPGRALVLVGVPLAIGLALAAWSGFGALARRTDPSASAHLLLGPVGTLATLLFSPGGGLYFAAPLAILAPLGLRTLRLSGESFVAWTSGLACVAHVAAVVSFPGWRDEAGYGPAALTAALPFLWVAVAHSLRWAEPRRWRRLVVWTLALLGIAHQLGGVVVDATTRRELALAALEREERAGHPSVHLAWRWELAPPWAHWRIFRHRVAVGSEEYPPDEVFFADPGAPLRPSHPRRVGAAHVAWFDLRPRFPGAPWLGGGLAAALTLVGLVQAQRTLRRFG